MTVQAFPHALQEIRADAGLAGKKFAVIADASPPGHRDTASEAPLFPDCVPLGGGQVSCCEEVLDCHVRDVGLCVDDELCRHISP